MWEILNTDAELNPMLHHRRCDHEDHSANQQYQLTLTPKPNLCSDMDGFENIYMDGWEYT